MPLPFGTNHTVFRVVSRRTGQKAVYRVFGSEASVSNYLNGLATPDGEHADERYEGKAPVEYARVSQITGPWEDLAICESHESFVATFPWTPRPEAYRAKVKGGKGKKPVKPQVRAPEPQPFQPLVHMTWEERVLEECYGLRDDIGFTMEQLDARPALDLLVSRLRAYGKSDVLLDSRPATA